MATLDEFTTATAAELARLVTEARAARRHVAHTPCDDRTPCRHCAGILDAHERINDHLSQLEEARLEAALEAAL